MAAPTTIIHTPTNLLENSLDFYQRLKFKVIPSSTSNFVTDGKAIIEINPSHSTRAGLKCFKANWDTEIKELEKQTAIIPIENGQLLSSPNNVKVYLMNGNAEIDFEPAESSFGLPGNFMGLSLETTDMSRSNDFWQILGYQKTYGDPEQGWMSFSNGSSIGVSLMKTLSCPHLFFNPSMTYFNGKNNLEVIKNIREAGIPITQEISHFNKEGIVDNIIIRDPGGYGFFLFSD